MEVALVVGLVLGLSIGFVSGLVVAMAFVKRIEPPEMGPDDDVDEQP